MGWKFSSSCFANCLFTFWPVDYLMDGTSAEVFWLDVFRLWISLLVSTHSTDVICLLSFPGYWHGQGQRDLAGGIRGWTVVGGFR